MVPINKTSIARTLVTVFCLVFTALSHAQSARIGALPSGTRRIVFLGDSITQAGDYVTDFECWLLAQGHQVEVLNLGLGSETASDLTPAENAGHLQKYGFGRPAISERLDRVLTATKPDVLIACYGMNDGGSLPADETGLERYARAVTTLRDTAIQSGVRCVVICTPPVHDAWGGPASHQHDDNLARYSAWLLSMRSSGWQVVDIHTPMRKALDDGRSRDPAFFLARDGTHPGREGHWLMAGAVLEQWLGARLDGVARAEDLFPARGDEIRKLVKARMTLLGNAWLTHTGHQRPKVAGGPGAVPGLSLRAADKQAAAISRQIKAMLPAGRPVRPAQLPP